MTVLLSQSILWSSSMLCFATPDLSISLFRQFLLCSDSLVLIVLHASFSHISGHSPEKRCRWLLLYVFGLTLPRREPCNCCVGTEVNMNSHLSTYSLDLFTINSLNIRNEDGCSWFQLFPVGLYRSKSFADKVGWIAIHSVGSKVRNLILLSLDPGIWSFWLMDQDVNNSMHSWWNRGGKIDSGYICWFSVHCSLYGVALWIVSHKHILKGSVPSSSLSVVDLM